MGQQPGVIHQAPVRTCRCVLSLLRRRHHLLLPPVLLLVAVTMNVTVLIINSVLSFCFRLSDAPSSGSVLSPGQYPCRITKISQNSISSTEHGQAATAPMQRETTCETTCKQTFSEHSTCPHISLPDSDEHQQGQQSSASRQ